MLIFPIGRWRCHQCFKNFQCFFYHASKKPWMRSQRRIILNEMSIISFFLQRRHLGKGKSTSMGCTKKKTIGIFSGGKANTKIWGQIFLTHAMQNFTIIHLNDYQVISNEDEQPFVNISKPFFSDFVNLLILYINVKCERTYLLKCIYYFLH